MKTKYTYKEPEGYFPKRIRDKFADEKKPKSTTKKKTSSAKSPKKK